MNLNEYNTIVISTSAGKDSQAMLAYVTGMAREQGFPLDRIVAVHADLGRVEWAGTAALAEQQATIAGVAFRKISRPQGDLLAQVRARGMWPSSTTRYCTSDQKRDQISKIVVQLEREWRAAGNQGEYRVLQCLGFRAEESPARAKREIFTINKRGSTKRRTVTDWLPIHDWTTAQVWETIKASGIPFHQAYSKGMPRLSCVFCIFAPRAALIIAGRENPDLLNEYVQVEAEINHTFRKDLSIASIKAAIESGEQVDSIPNWEM